MYGINDHPEGRTKLLTQWEGFHQEQELSAHAHMFTCAHKYTHNTIGILIPFGAIKMYEIG